MLLPFHLNGLNLDSATAVVVLTGTATAGLTETDLDTSGQTFIWTLTNDAFAAAGTGPIGSTADTQAFIDGIVSDGAEAFGWNNIRSNIDVTDLTRDSDTQATLTLPALTTHEITSNETLTSTVPAAVLTGGSPLVASQTVLITADVVSTRKGKRAKRVRYVVEVDGEFIQAASIVEAESILMQAEALAKEAAPKDVKRARVRIKPPRIAVKTASGKPSTSVILNRSVNSTQEKITAIYRKAHQQIEQEREIAQLLQRKIDEEEAITALLL